MKTSRSFSIAALALASVTSLLVTQLSCSVLDRATATGARFFVTPASIGHVDGEVFESIMVQRFRTIPPSDQSNFCYLQKDGSWQADAVNGWFVDPADMFCDVMTQALEQSGRFRIVGLEGVGLRFDFRLDGVVESLYADYTDPNKPRAIVQLRGYLFDRRVGDARLVASLWGNGSSDIAGRTSFAVADAFSRASEQAMRELVVSMPKTIAPTAAAPADK